MGLLRRMYDRGITPQMLFGTGVDTWIGQRNDAGVRVDESTALGYSGIWAAVTLLAGDIATFPMDAFVKDGTTRRPLRPKPAWIEEPDQFDPSVTRMVHFGQVAVSLLLNGNAYTRCFPSVVEPQVLEVINPLSVEVTKTRLTPEYHLLDQQGRRLGDPLTPMDIVHTKMPWTQPGKQTAPSPIEYNAGSIGISLAARKWVERFFGQGNTIPGFVVLPAGATTDDQKATETALAQKHGGWRRAGIMGILRGGATFAQTGITPQQADLSSIFGHQLEEAARIYGIPPFMIGSQEPAGVAYASAVERAQHYIDHCLRHYTEPIEIAYRRLVPGGTDTYLKFNYDALLRGDTKSRFDAYGVGLQNKFLYLEDVWRKEDLDPNRQGTFLETPNNNGPRDAAPAPSVPAARPTNA